MINRKLLPIKAHYFFFMAAMGPILPQLSVYGKEMGISSVVMGSVTGILPLTFLIAKPIFGLVVDVYRDYRKAIFMTILSTMTISYACLFFIPSRTINTYDIQMNCDLLDTCNVTSLNSTTCDNINSVTCRCKSDPDNKITGFIRTIDDNQTQIEKIGVCPKRKFNFCNQTCDVHCIEDIEIHSTCLYSTSTFWIFIVLMCIGTICFNVSNSLTDAICFDVIGDEYDYGKQRVWGTIGFGLTAVISGFAVNYWSNGSITYRPAIICMLICFVFDLIACSRVQLPVIEAPANIFKDLMQLLNDRFTIVFITFSVLAGVVDGFLIYFLFWYLEDLALLTNTANIKLLEGLIVAAETLGGEVIFFYISGSILERFGHAQTFSMCFLFYALRLGIVSIIPSPWWILLSEFLLQGPTYALTYTTIVAYANEIAPPGMSATMQGLAAGMDDGFGYALGSFIGGLLYKYVGGKATYQIFTAFALICSITHVIIHKKFLKIDEDSEVEDVKYVDNGDIDEKTEKLQKVSGDKVGQNDVKDKEEESGDEDEVMLRRK